MINLLLNVNLRPKVPKHNNGIDSNAFFLSKYMYNTDIRMCFNRIKRIPTQQYNFREFLRQQN